MADNTFSGTGETPENQPPQFVLDSSTNQKEDGNQAIAQMTAIRNPSGTSYLPRVTVGNCEAASKLFDPAAPLTAIVPGMNRKDTTTRVTNEWTIPVEDDRTRGVAVLDLRDPTLRYMLGSGLGPPTKVTDFNKRVVEIDLNDGSYGAIFGGSGHFHDTKFKALTWTPATGNKNETPASVELKFDRPRTFFYGNSKDGQISMPANHLSISDNRWPFTRRNAGLGSDYTLTFKDDFSREVRFGMAKDGSITSFSQNMANNRLYPGTENGNFLQSLPKLQDLGLIKASNEQLSNVGRLTQLRRLHIHLDDDTTSGAALNKMNRLEDLNLVGGRISDFSFLRNKPNMRSLELSSMPITGAQLENLRRMSKLDTLVVWNSEVDDTGAKHLGSMSSLRNLNLGYAKISDKSMEQINHLTGLKELGLKHDEISDDGVQRLAGLTNLEKLSLQETKITDKALETVAKMSKLSDLNLNLTTITEHGLAHLNKLPNLKHLELALVPITDAGLKEIAKLENLEELCIDPSRISNAGLQQLVNCKNLKFLTLCGLYYPNSNFNVEGLNELQQKMPNLQITKSI